MPLAHPVSSTPAANSGEPVISFALASDRDDDGNEESLPTPHRTNRGVASSVTMEFTRDNWYQITVKSEPRRLRYVGPAMTGWPPDPLQPSGLHIFTDEEERLVGVAELEVDQAEQEN